MSVFNTLCQITRLQTAAAAAAAAAAAVVRDVVVSLP